MSGFCCGYTRSARVSLLDSHALLVHSALRGGVFMHGRLAAIVLILVVFLVAVRTLRAQRKSPDAAPHPWYQHAVFYEIYPRSFMDSNRRRHRRPERHRVEARLFASSRRGRHLDRALLPFTASGFRLRRFGLRKHRQNVRHPRRFRPPAEARRGSWHQNHSRLRREPHFRPASLVRGFPFLAHFTEARLVHLARRQGQRQARWHGK